MDLFPIQQPAGIYNNLYPKSSAVYCLGMGMAADKNKWGSAVVVVVCAPQHLDMVTYVS